MRFFSVDSVYFVVFVLVKSLKRNSCHLSLSPCGSLLLYHRSCFSHLNPCVRVLKTLIVDSWVPSLFFFLLFGVVERSGQQHIPRVVNAHICLVLFVVDILRVSCVHTSVSALLRVFQVFFVRFRPPRLASSGSSSRSSPWTGSAASGGADHRRRGGGGDLQDFLPGQGGGSTTLRGAELRCVGLVEPFSDVKKLVQFSLRNLDIVSSSPIVSGSHSSSCSCDSYGGFWKNFQRLPGDGGPGSCGRRAAHP